MVPSKVEISLRKADQVAWGKLEDPSYKPEPEPVDDTATETNESHQPHWDIEDDDISDSDEEWAYDTPENKKANDKDKDEQKKQAEEVDILKRKEEVEKEMKTAMEERKRAEEEKKKLDEQRKEEEAGGYDDMPDLE